MPQEALLYVYGVYKVFVVEGDTVKEKEVKIGERAGEKVEVIEGLSASDEWLCRSRAQELKDGARIESVQ